MDQQHEPRWQPTRKQVLWAGAAIGLLTVAILVGYRYDITLWDWLKLLVVPAVIAGGGLWFNRQQRERELETADRRTQDETLQAYLDQIGHLQAEVPQSGEGRGHGLGFRLRDAETSGAHTCRHGPAHSPGEGR